MPSARLPNVHLKLSGFHYATSPESDWDFPYSDVRWLFEEAYRAFGSRMVWGSDYPVVAKAMTHRQALEAFRTHCSFVSEEDKVAILGGTLMIPDGAGETPKINPAIATSRMPIIIDPVILR